MTITGNKDLTRRQIGTTIQEAQYARQTGDFVLQKRKMCDLAGITAQIGCLEPDPPRPDNEKRLVKKAAMAGMNEAFTSGSTERAKGAIRDIINDEILEIPSSIVEDVTTKTKKLLDIAKAGFAIAMIKGKEAAPKCNDEPQNPSTHIVEFLRTQESREN